MLDHVTGHFVFYSANIDPDVWPLSASETSHDQLDSVAHSDQSIIVLDTQQSTSAHDPHSWVPLDMTDDVSFSSLSYSTPVDWDIEPQIENRYVRTPSPDPGQVPQIELPYFLRRSGRRIEVEQDSQEAFLQYDGQLRDFVFLPAASYDYADQYDSLSASDFKSDAEESSSPEPYVSETSNDSWLR